MVDKIAPQVTMPYEKPVNELGIPIWREFDFTPPAELETDKINSVPSLIVGGGPIGLTVGLDLARRGHQVIILNQLSIVPDGSKAICWSKRSLDIYTRLGIGEKMVAKGVSWNLGKVFWQNDKEPVYQFDLLPIKQQKNPAFINLQQFFVEEFLVDKLLPMENVDIRWQNKVVAVEKLDKGVRVEIETPQGNYKMDTQYLIVCDGNKSPVRNMLGLDFEGRIFEDNFLIADIRFKQELPVERRFWFDPPFPGASALLHKQPDNIWRADFQLGWDIDKAEAIKPENVEPFVRGMLGADIEFEYEWISVYTFQCRRMARFVHDRFFFLGDSAHLVSPFGARGGNGGIADADNFVWKLDLVLKGLADERLLESYNEESVLTADENIRHSTRTTDFLTPKNEASHIFRNAVLELAKKYDFARALVNSGRLSTPIAYPNSSLNAADSDIFKGGIAPGTACPDAPLNDNRADNQWLLERLGGVFNIMIFGDEKTYENIEAQTELPVTCLYINDEIDREGLVKERFAAQAGDVYLIRPDQYVAGRWHKPQIEQVLAALKRATAHAP